MQDLQELLRKIINEEFEKLQNEDNVFAVCLLVRNKSGEILAVSRKNNPNDFGLPGGKVDPGETPVGAAAREMMEETGLTAKNLKLVFTRFEGDKKVSTYSADIEGKISTSEAGVVKWVQPEILLAGSFGVYNKALFDSLSIK